MRGAFGMGTCLVPWTSELFDPRANQCQPGVIDKVGRERRHLTGTVAVADSHALNDAAPGRVSGIHPQGAIPRVAQGRHAHVGPIGRVRAKDTPGFIVNHAGRGYVTEAFRLLGESVAEFHQIDRILKDAAGFRMGPFELMDLTGLDVTHPVIESIYHQYYQEPRYRPSPLAQQRVTAGVLGRKTGRGFYRYQGQQAEIFPVEPLPSDQPTKVWVSRQCAGTRETLTKLVAKLGGQLDNKARPAGESLCLIAPFGLDATSATLAEGLDPTRTLAIDSLLGFEKHRTLMMTPVTSEESRRQALGLFGSDGVPVTVLRDSTGFVTQRVLATIVNIACDMAQQQVATPQDIDRAVTLGLGYPKGPLALGDALGSNSILQILQNIFQISGDPRYRPSPWLRRRAQLQISLLTTEGG